MWTRGQDDPSSLFLALLTLHRSPGRTAGLAGFLAVSAGLARSRSPLPGDPRRLERRARTLRRPARLHAGDRARGTSSRASSRPSPATGRLALASGRGRSSARCGGGRQDQRDPRHADGARGAGRPPSRCCTAGCSDFLLRRGRRPSGAFFPSRPVGALRCDHPARRRAARAARKRRRGLGAGRPRDRDRERRSRTSSSYRSRRLARPSSASPCQGRRPRRSDHRARARPAARGCSAPSAHQQAEGHNASRAALQAPLRLGTLTALTPGGRAEEVTAWTGWIGRRAGGDFQAAPARTPWRVRFQINTSEEAMLRPRQPFDSRRLPVVVSPGRRGGGRARRPRRGSTSATRSSTRRSSPKPDASRPRRIPPRAS